MKGEHMKRTIILTTGLLLFIYGCTWESLPPEDKGSLNLTFSSEEQFEEKTIVPRLDMNVSVYDIYGTGPENRFFNRLDVTASTVLQASLAPGEWAISVNAKNRDGVIIGKGHTKAVITAGKITRARAKVCPAHGEGTLGIQVIWPEDLIENPIIKAEITPEGGSPMPLPFVLGCNMRSAYFLGSLKSGYYTVSIHLFDGDDLLWGTVEAVRIIAGVKTCKIYVLVKDMCRGGLMLSVKLDMQNPVNIEFIGAEMLILSGSEMTVTAVTSEPVDSYQWYLDGILLEGDTWPTVTVGKTLEPGFYMLDLLVEKGPILSSEGISFEVF
jgi:hypothetical protein